MKRVIVVVFSVVVALWFLGVFMEIGFVAGAVLRRLLGW
jgi:hypothetical protein